MHDLMSFDLKRVKNLFYMDLWRMSHGKVFYVMVGISIFIPIMMLTQMSDIRNIMEFIGGNSPSDGFGAGMNLSMLNVLTGILLSINIGKEHSSGFIKNIITAHANKYDYLASKSLIALICNAVFIFVYLVTLFVLGAIMGLPMELPSVFGLTLYVIEKIFLSVPISLLMITINMIFRRSYGWSIMFVCIAATGVVVMSLQMGLQMLGLDTVASILNFTITGVSAFTTTTPRFLNLFVVIAVSVVWTLIWSLIGNLLINKRDVI